MKKRMLCLILGIGLITACGKEEVKPADEKIDEEVESVNTDEEVVDNKYSREELNAYSQILEEHLKECPDGFGVNLIYIDEDDTYELAIIDGDAHNEGAYLYTYSDGKAVSLQSEAFPFYGSYGTFFYSEKNNYFCYDWDGASADYGNYMFFAFSIKDGKAVPYCELYRKFYFDDDFDDVFENNNEKITQEEYESLYEKYWYDYINDDLIDADYGHCEIVTSEDEIDTFLKNHEEDEVIPTYTEEELKAMSPRELFDAFCAGSIQAECYDSYSDDSYLVDTSYMDFDIDGDATEVVIPQKPVDLDNDGEVEFILRNPVYGDMCFDCKDGKVTIFAHGEGTAAYCSYVTYKDAVWIVHSDTTHGGRVYYNFDKYDGDLNIVESFNLYWYAEDEAEEMKTYYYNDEEITEAEYNAYYEEIFGE